MSNSFSYRQGLKKEKIIKKNTLPCKVRNRLWNKLRDYINKFNTGKFNRNDIIKYLWDRFFKKDIDVLKCNHSFDSTYYLVDQIKEEFFKLKWYEVYDFLEFLIKIDNRLYKDLLVRDINQIFNDEGIYYKIINNYVVSSISDEEVLEIEYAIESNHSEASSHIIKSLELYSRRPTADYKNSIKESICSLEALAKSISNKPSGTLGELTQHLNIHKSFKNAIKNLYGWTSDEGGIRHSENGDVLNSGEREARFMVVVCSAFINYIESQNLK